MNNYCFGDISATFYFKKIQCRIKGFTKLSLGILNIILSSMGRSEQRGDHLINNSNLFRLPPEPLFMDCNQTGKHASYAFVKVGNELEVHSANVLSHCYNCIKSLKICIKLITDIRICYKAPSRPKMIHLTSVYRRSEIHSRFSANLTDHA